MAEKGTKRKTTPVKDEQVKVPKSQEKAGGRVECYKREGTAIHESEKRKPLSKDEYYMGLAVLTSYRSEDPTTKVGSCIINKECRIVGLGFNQMPYGCKGKTWSGNGKYEKDSKYPYVIHAALDAVTNSNFTVKGCTLYTTQLPCNECSKIIIQAGCSKVIYMRDKYSHEKYKTKSTEKMLDIAGVKYLKYKQLQVQPTNGIKLTKTTDAGVSYEKSHKTLTAEDVKGTEVKMHTLSRDDYFMYVAIVSSLRSKDPVTKVGACIVHVMDERDKIMNIVGIGYNGMPNNCSDDQMPWDKSEENEEEDKHSYVCHAELNAIMNKNSFDVKNCIVYVTLFPCNECAKIMIQSVIKEVVYMNDIKEKDQMKRSREMLDAAGVKLRQFIPEEKELHLEFQHKDGQ